MQNWVDLYKELCSKITESIPEVKWVDLWHNQVNFLESEHPFPTPAVFLSFRILTASDFLQRAQEVDMQVSVYLFYETFADTYAGAYNQTSALDFLDILSKLQGLFHASQGENYSSMRRTGFAPVDTGSAGNLYMQTFNCKLIDYAAAKEWADAEIGGLEISKGTRPEPEAEPDEPLFEIPG